MAHDIRRRTDDFGDLSVGPPGYDDVVPEIQGQTQKALIVPRRPAITPINKPGKLFVIFAAMTILGDPDVTTVLISPKFQRSPHMARKGTRKGGKGGCK